MASINHYPPRSQEQVFNCMAEANVIGREGDLQYMLVRMVDWQEGGDSVKGQTVFRSAFPFYVYWTANGPQFYGFVRGEDSLEVRTNWDNFVDMSDPPDSRALEHAYLHNCVTKCSDAFSGMGSAGVSVGSTIVDGVDTLQASSTYTTIVDEGEHLGAIRAYAGSVILLHGNSTLPTDPEVAPITGPITIRMSIASILVNNRYYGNYLTGPYGDYRIVYGKSFSSIQEWFQYCKTH